MVVELRDIRVRYGDFEALRGITLSLPAGVTGLVGRNGTGKSTLLRLLLGLVSPTAGEGAVLGISLSEPGAVLRRAVGFMPENDTILPGMAGHDHVALAGELCGMSARQARRRAHEVLAYVDLGEARYRRAEQYSAGMKQRLKLAIALVADPALLLLDEPTVGLDPPGRKRMLDLIGELAHKHGKSILISTHLLADVETTCSRLAAIEAGKILAEGALATVLNRDVHGYRLEWSAPPDAAKLRDALSKLDAREIAHNRDLESNDPVGVRIELEMPGGTEPRRLFELARTLGVELLTFEPLREDLAALYARLMGKPREMDRACL